MTDKSIASDTPKRRGRPPRRRAEAAADEQQEPQAPVAAAPAAPAPQPPAAVAPPAPAPAPAAEPEQDSDDDGTPDPAPRTPDSANPLAVPPGKRVVIGVTGEPGAGKSSLSRSLGQQFIVENRPGGGTTIGTRAVVTAPAVQRLDAETITRDQQRAARSVQHHQRPHAIAACQRVGAPVFQRGEQHLGVAVAHEGMAQRLQLGTQLEVVVDLAVVDHPAGAALHGLMAPGRQVDDG